MAGAWHAAPGRGVAERASRALRTVARWSPKISASSRPKSMHCAKHSACRECACCNSRSAAIRTTRTCRRTIVANTVAYTGTHDNDTTLGWYQSLRAGGRDAAVDRLAGGAMPWALDRAAVSLGCQHRDRADAGSARSRRPSSDEHAGCCGRKLAVALRLVAADAELAPRIRSSVALRPLGLEHDRRPTAAASATAMREAHAARAFRLTQRPALPRLEPP